MFANNNISRGAHSYQKDIHKNVNKLKIRYEKNHCIYINIYGGKFLYVLKQFKVNEEIFDFSHL